MGYPFVPWCHAPIIDSLAGGRSASLAWPLGFWEGTGEGGNSHGLDQGLLLSTYLSDGSWKIGNHRMARWIYHTWYHGYI